jgi:hypothetical protein
MNRSRSMTIAIATTDNTSNIHIAGPPLMIVCKNPPMSTVAPRASYVWRLRMRQQENSSGKVPAGEDV